jgi:hypothetical protein
VCLNISPSALWPVRAQSVQFAGHEVWIIPLTLEEHPGIAMNRSPDISDEEAEGILYRLLSVLAWRESTGLTVAHRTGGSWPMMMALDRHTGFATRQPFDFTEVICPEELAPRIALGLMREGRSLNHAAYAFLSFWRVLELAFPKTRDRVSWMQDVLPTLAGHDVLSALNSVHALGVDDVCLHLRDSGRCAIAHAGGGLTVNPDDPRDARRLAQELPLVREFAVRAIEDRFGIDSPSTEFREHLYELRGWKQAIGSEMVERLKSGDETLGEGVIDLPVISLRLRDRPAYQALENMTPTQANVTDGLLHLEYRSADALMAIRFALDFRRERVMFDLEHGLFGHDDGSVETARYRVDARRFFRDMLLNGELRMLEAESGALISRLDPLIPVNCVLDLEASNATIAEAEAELDRRMAASAAARRSS